LPAIGGAAIVAAVGERSSYPPGTFSWADLATTDHAGAKRFYSGLFGWTAEDMPAGEDTVYSIARVDGKSVAAIAPQPAQQAQAGVPPMWQSYVTVESADASAARAAELGASVHAHPFDVLEAGRMAVIQDPQGAYFMLWEPKLMIGAQLVNGPGLLSWNELATPDVDGSIAFYGSLLGWKVEPFPDSPMPYWTIQTAAGRGNGGIRQPQPGEPANWGVYFGSPDVEASLARAAELGGERIAGPMPIGPGMTMGVIRDPQGAVLLLYNGPFED
jgi:predicted enzyme related to lactoylglutathione lyase